MKTKKKKHIIFEDLRLSKNKVLAMVRVLFACLFLANIFGLIDIYISLVWKTIFIGSAGIMIVLAVPYLLRSMSKNYVQQQDKGVQIRIGSYEHLALSWKKIREARLEDETLTIRMANKRVHEIPLQHIHREDQEKLLQILSGGQ